ncbi:MAG: HD domain-containing protein [Campylobacterota bacterium]|nr:HD domain-containing protein [Campylobacterota bacterium]
MENSNIVININNSIFSKIFWITLLFKQNRWHRYGVLLHTFKVVYGVLKAKDYKFLAAALFHDIGKPSVAYQDSEDILTGEYSFTDHEEKSYQIVKNWFFLSAWTKKVIRYHYIIRDLKNSKRKGLTSRLKRLESSWATLDEVFIKELEIFLVYDDYGKV